MYYDYEVTMRIFGHIEHTNRSFDFTNTITIDSKRSRAKQEIIENGELAQIQIVDYSIPRFLEVNPGFAIKDDTPLFRCENDEYNNNG